MEVELYLTERIHVKHFGLVWTYIESFPSSNIHFLCKVFESKELEQNGHRCIQFDKISSLYHSDTLYINYKWMRER
jgi:hypothetical protein